jgi:hypothetical protein
MEAAVEASRVDWTIARPPRLVATRDEGYRAQEGALPDGLTLTAKLSWRAVAAFLLDALDDGRYVRKVVGIRA